EMAMTPVGLIRGSEDRAAHVTPCGPIIVPADPAPDYGPALAYIDSFWDRLIRHQPEDRGHLIGLPRPFLIPSSDPSRPLFQEFYYWDTYFMCLGVYDTAREWLILDAAENCASLIDRFGFIPNGSRYY